MDLFENYKELPKIIQDFIGSFDEEKDPYKECDRVLKACERYGYTFEYGLDGIPFNLQKCDPNTNEVGGTTYVSYKVIIGSKTLYYISVVYGEHNYISVKKMTANPYGLLGKQFNSFDEATKHYKSPEIKLALLKIETGLN